MQALAEELGTRTFGFDNADPEGQFHAHSISLQGVLVKKKDLEFAATMIRDNPRLYRLGKEFYSYEENERNRVQFVEHLQEAYDLMGHYGNREQVARQFFERIEEVYGPEASVTAKEAYKQWKLEEL